MNSSEDMAENVRVFFTRGFSKIQKQITAIRYWLYHNIRFRVLFIYKPGYTTTFDFAIVLYKENPCDVLEYQWGGVFNRHFGPLFSPLPVNLMKKEFKNILMKEKKSHI